MYLNFLYALAIALLMSSVVATMYLDCTSIERHCGWELMQYLEIPISTLGDLYAQQTGDESLCVGAEKGLDYCTCVLGCGNGIWRCDEDGGWMFESECKKYCHIGICDGQDP